MTGSEVIGLLVVLLIGSSYPGSPVRAATVAVGVKAGDWMTYTFKYTFSSANASATPPSGMKSYQDASGQIANLSVNSVTGYMVNATMAQAYKNGTVITTPYTVNLAVGDSIIYLGPFPANLTTDDTFSMGDLFLIFGGSYRANETLTQTYGGVERSVDHLSVLSSSTSYTYGISIFWDRLTGWVTESIMFITYSNAGVNASQTVSWTFDKTNVWSPLPAAGVGDLLFYAALAGVVVAAVAISFVLKRKPKLAVEEPIAASSA